MLRTCLATLCVLSCLRPVPASAEPPGTAYIFPAGGQRGTTVNVRIGGHFLYDKAELTLIGPGINAAPFVERTKTVWFEGPVITQPASQQKEDYPKDYSAQFQIAADASPGARFWHCSTSQGITPGLKFVVGTLPEILEDEMTSDREARPVALPVTINGRIFPREDVDDWAFDAKAGQIVTCEVNAARLGSGLDSRLEIRGPRGQLVAENSDSLGTDSFVRFTAPDDGRYVARIHDIRFEGLQHFVYRLTISSDAWLDQVYPLGGRRGSTVAVQLSGANLARERVDFAVPAADDSGPSRVSLFGAGNALASFGAAMFESDDLPEHLESEPNHDLASAAQTELPAVFNGRIDRSGDHDVWKFSGKKGDAWQFELRASRLGSPLDGLLTLLDEKRNTLATADDLSNGQTDAVLTTTLPADGIYLLRVEERLASRGGPAYSYRVRAVRPSAATLKLTTLSNAITVLRGGETRVKIQAERPQGFADEIPLTVEGLPDGVTTTTTKLGKGQNQVEVVLKANDNAKVMTSRIRILGHFKIGDTESSTSVTPQRSADDPGLNEILVRVGVPTPFKLKGVFETKYAPRGSVFVRKYHVDRNGFTGSLWAELADRQARHLQGVTGPKVELAADQSDFEYPVTLPPWMEIGRTSRSCVAVLGEVVDPDGTRHIVSHTSQNQDDQTIVIVEPNRLSLEVNQVSLRWVAGETVKLPVRVSRAVGLRGPVRVVASFPNPGRGIEVSPIEIAESSSTGDVLVRFATDAAPPQSPVIIKLIASISDERGFPTTDETLVQILNVE